MSTQRYMHLALVVGDAGFHQAAWRQADSGVGQLTSLQLFSDLAQRAERACVDSLFVADVAGFDPQSVSAWPSNQLEPLTLLAALAAVTQRIGLIGTLSTTYSAPYTLARQVLSLDHLSGGRAGWNVVVSRGGEGHYGLAELPSHSHRYERASETLQAAQSLWDGWAPDAVVADRASSIYARPERIHSTDFIGEHVQVHGALPSPRSPQGRPLIVQAGASEEGRELAARYADIVFTMQADAQEAAAFYQDLKQRAERHGRRREDLLVLQGVTPFCAKDHDSAVALQQSLAVLTDRRAALKRLSGLLNGIDCADLPLDQPLPEALHQQARISAPSTAATQLLNMIKQQLPLGDVLQRLVSSRGHWTPTGSFEEIASQLQARFDAQQTDGYVVLPAELGSSLDGLLDQVIPILQGRGTLRNAYRGKTLREHLDLPLPQWQLPVQGTI